MESHAAAHACRDTLDPARAPTSADNQAKRAVQTGAIPLANAIAPAPDSSAIAKLGANDPIDSRPASERLTAKGQVQVELGLRAAGEKPRASSGSNVGLNGAAHEQNVVLVPWSLGRTTTESRRLRADVLRRQVGRATRGADDDVPDELVEVLGRRLRRRSRAAPAVVSQAELVRRWRPDGARPAADPPGGRVWRADGSSSRALPRELRSPGQPTLTGASGDEVRLDVLACAVGDPMPADDAGSSTTSRLSHPMRASCGSALTGSGSEPASTSDLQPERGSSHSGIAS